ncbi:hypothetical protein B0H66DRAFT_595881 [Apodospora peruviana]|uniref:Uncharacterized protein n=1 Tax=Apodospora peruviana TaxID=516989 RepID=A0AAE0HSX0_9PEZI|nr:hypothetical protein B0H66DRAFT_595881 [Apodospora peruviana]
MNNAISYTPVDFRIPRLDHHLERKTVEWEDPVVDASGRPTKEVKVQKKPINFTLYGDVVPKTTKNFKELEVKEVAMEAPPLGGFIEPAPTLERLLPVRVLWKHYTYGFCDIERLPYILTHAQPQHREVVAAHIRKHMVSLRGSKFGSRCWPGYGQLDECKRKVDAVNLFSPNAEGTNKSAWGMVLAAHPHLIRLCLLTTIRARRPQHPSRRLPYRLSSVAPTLLCRPNIYIKQAETANQGGTSTA